MYIEVIEDDNLSLSILELQRESCYFYPLTHTADNTSSPKHLSSKEVML